MKKAYAIKISLIPTNKKYKSAVLPGIVFASDQATAVKLATDKVMQVVGSGDNLPDFKPKLLSCTKMTAEFVLYEPEQEEIKNKNTKQHESKPNP